MDLAELAATSEAVAATSARGGKVAALADRAALDAGPDEVPAAVAFLSGELRQRQIGVGWAALRELPAPAAEPELTVADVDARAASAIGALPGRARSGARRAALDALFAPRDRAPSSASCARCWPASCARARSRA